MPLYEYSCTECRKNVDLLIPYNRRDEEMWHHDEEETECEGQLFRNITAPHTNTRMSKSFVDGTKRKGFEDFRKIATLEVERGNLDDGDPRKTEIDTEITERERIR